MKRPGDSSHNRSLNSVGVSFARAAALAKKLPEVTESTSYGTPALKVAGKLFARLKEDGETLVLKMDVVSRDFLLRAEPELFYLTDHYRNYSWILLRLSRVTEDRLGELLADAWKVAAPRRLRLGFESGQPNTIIASGRKNHPLHSKGIPTEDSS